MADRSLAHVEIIDNVTDLEGYDRVGLATILGWKVIVAKDELKAGDKCVYFEIDSLVNPEDKRFAFMEKRKYKVKTQRMCKTISQGLAMPISAFPELGDPKIGTDVTKQLKVTYYDPADRQRKKNITTSDPNAKYKSMAARHKNLFQKRPIRWLMKREWGKKLLFLVFGKSKDKPKQFPSWIRKSDETRCENIPWILDEDVEYSVTEKIDGTSTTFFVEKKRFGKYEFGVCSRNVRQMNQDQKTFHETNVYWEMANKYNIKEKLIKIAENTNSNRVYLQGETFGLAVQGNPYKMDHREMRAFTLSIDGRRATNENLFYFCRYYDIPHVPSIYTNHKLPSTMENLKAEAEGQSVINPDVLREGLVYRTDQGFSFKNVATSYLLKKK